MKFRIALWLIATFLLSAALIIEEVHNVFAATCGMAYMKLTEILIPADMAGKEGEA